MRTSLSRESTTPPATERQASFFMSPRHRWPSRAGRCSTADLRGAATPAEGDLIFSTAATGWGEILTDPSYAGQIVILTHPMVGSYRIDPAELESDRVHPRAVVVTRLVTPPAGPGRSFEELLVEAGIPALEGIDTRALTLELRRGAARKAVIRPAAGRGRGHRARRRRSPAGRRSTTSRRSRRGSRTASHRTARGAVARPSSTSA